MNNKKRTRYSKKFKESSMARMMPPNNEPIKSLSKELGVSEQSLYKWRQKARAEGQATPGNVQNSERWNSEEKFLIVMETFSMNQIELAAYCRKKGLYKEEIDAWRISCLGANTGEINQTKILSQELKEEKNVQPTLKRICVKKRKHWQKLRPYYC